MNNVNKYFDHYGYTKNIKSIYQLITNVQLDVNQEETRTINDKTKQVYHEKRIKRETEDIDESILIKIHNEPKFIQLIKSLSQPKQPSIYIYTQQDCVVLMITSSMYYPLVIVKFPVSPPYVYVKPNLNMCFLFQRNSLIQGISSNDKCNSNYTLIVKLTDIIEIEYSSNNSKVKSSNIILVDKNELFNNQLVNKLSILDIQEKEMFRNMLESHIDYYYKIQTLDILLLFKSNLFSAHNISPKKICSEHCLKIKPNNIKVTINNSQINNKLYIWRNNGNNENIIYWNKEIINNIRFKFIKYISLFKNSDKLLGVGDNVYYCLKSFGYYNNKLVVLFMKIITKDDINLTNINLDYIIDNYVISEYVMCYQI